MDTENKTPQLSSIGYITKTREDLKLLVPAAFSFSKQPERSDKYSFLSTTQLLDNFENAGWVPTHAKQTGSSPYSRHIIRLSNPDIGWLPIKGDKVRPQAVIDNSHNGGSSAQLHMGLFRLVCTNGLVIAMPGLATSIKIRHMGFDPKEVVETMGKISEDYKLVTSRIGDWQNVTMNRDQKEEFVIKALAIREPNAFIQEDGSINTKRVLNTNNPIELIKPIRGEDEANNLWTVFNVVQERMLKGGYTRKTLSGRNSTARGITNATRGIEYNKQLWQLAEEFAS